MTDMTHSATNGQAAQTKAATVKTTLRSNIGRSANGFSAQGLYDPRNEHDACGVGFIVNMKGVKSHQIVEDGLAVLENLTHRGAIADQFFRDEMAAQGIELPPAGQYGVGHWFMPQDAA
ncbi:hypothetical protein EN994_01980, partial [Mesorhizobium sp. M7A.F.Ca.CA.002.09.1.1]|uniref:hypothetical protein n=1 Tax=Mesorhizobium sp. M7A.F.Ca.CA.002.09.1.1 TaxID=2496739 RepID=UPI000FD1919E